MHNLLLRKKNFAGSFHWAGMVWCDAMPLCFSYHQLTLIAAEQVLVFETKHRKVYQQKMSFIAEAFPKSDIQQTGKGMYTRKLHDLLGGHGIRRSARPDPKHPRYLSMIMEEDIDEISDQTI